MAIRSVGTVQQTQAPQKFVKAEKQEKTYDAGELCEVICTPGGNTVRTSGTDTVYATSNGGPILPV